MLQKESPNRSFKVTLHVNKLKMVKGSNNFIFSGIKRVKHLRRRQYYPRNTRKTIDFELGPLLPFAHFPTFETTLSG